MNVCAIKKSRPVKGRDYQLVIPPITAFWISQLYVNTNCSSSNTLQVTVEPAKIYFARLFDFRTQKWYL